MQYSLSSISPLNTFTMSGTMFKYDSISSVISISAASNNGQNGLYKFNLVASTSAGVFGVVKVEVTVKPIIVFLPPTIVIPGVVATNTV